MGTALAAYALENAVGQSFDAYTRQFILETLGMKTSGWSLDLEARNVHTKFYESSEKVLPLSALVTYPDGGFISSTRDLAILLSELLQGLQGKCRLLTVSTYKEFFKPQLSADPFLERNSNSPYHESYYVGIFIGFGYSGLIGHTYGDPGVTTCMFIDPHTMAGCLLLINTSIVDQRGVNVYFEILEAEKKGASGSLFLISIRRLKLYTAPRWHNTYSAE